MTVVREVITVLSLSFRRVVRVSRTFGSSGVFAIDALDNVIISDRFDSEFIDV